MLYVIIGSFGFISLLVFDFMSLNNKVFLKYLFFLLGIGFIMYSTISLTSFNNNIIINYALRSLSLVFAILFIALLIFSVFIEVGSNTYQKIANPQLVTNGTYSLVRHPGVIWLFLVYISLAIFSANSYFLITAVVWTIINAIYVSIQEKLILVKLFPHYDEYIKTTPMLVPNYLSIKKFTNTENWRKE